MPKGIRKACANCIKARLACDEGRPCQRCVVHACECIAVPRKPRVKKQKIDVEPPPSADKLHIPSIDSSADVVAPNWSQTEFAQGAFGTFQLDRTVQDETQFDGFAPNALLSPAITSPRSPIFLDTSASFQQLSPPMMQMASQIPSPPQVFTPPASPATIWNVHTRQMPTNLVQHLLPSPTPVSPSALTCSGQLSPPQFSPPSPQMQPQVVPTPSPPQQASPRTQVPSPDLKRQGGGYDSAQLLSMLLEEKPLLTELQEAQLNNFLDAQTLQAMNFYDPTLFKKHIAPQAVLPQAMNATTLYPAPVAVFDKMKFQLLDANEAMAKFIGYSTVAEMAGKVTNMDDIIDPEAAQVAKQAYTNFVTNPNPCFRLGEIRAQGGVSKTVEFHVDLTEQLLIFTVKSVFDNSSRALPDVQYQQLPVKTDMTPQQCKAFEFLSPID